ncbi:phage protein [Aeromonas hydrophila]|uniref:phage protein n=1 Tax=Aeromonas hydrophila TaxID=644 RepID=UPI000332B6B0|nr:phage protein [Aeromonas hydrophila]AGM45689.1 phage protein [Aeromonas hydrophila ML09-119]AHX34307.1 hypothetical protein V428_20430 [Aeromonas hydrophila subsp. hydrophila AL09-71]AHX71108.1 hypothetical protein V429_20465 [Aeromonas hydrophila pc104A]AXV28541.1 hypothetical protein BFW97_03040 [Aeromonas hydrophila]KYQ08425.1 hypothetical protein AW872_15115 [Aeromonas hydrophila]
MSTFKELFSNVLLALVLLMGAALFLGSRMLESRGKALATANETISTLQQTNEQQASQLVTLQRDAEGMRTLLGTQNAALADLDQLNRKTAYELEQALATPPAGRPNCAVEPLPAGALRLLQPAHNRGANAGHQAPAAAGGDPPLPGA